MVLLQPFAKVSYLRGKRWLNLANRHAPGEFVVQNVHRAGPPLPARFRIIVNGGYTRKPERPNARHIVLREHQACPTAFAACSDCFVATPILQFSVTRRLAGTQVQRVAETQINVVVLERIVHRAINELQSWHFCEFRFNPAADSDLMPATVPI